MSDERKPDHADLGAGTTHHGSPDECGCWPRLVADLRATMTAIAAAMSCEPDDDDADLVEAVRLLVEERDEALRRSRLDEEQCDDVTAAAGEIARQLAEAAAQANAIREELTEARGLLDKAARIELRSGGEILHTKSGRWTFADEDGCQSFATLAAALAAYRAATGGGGK